MKTNVLRISGALALAILGAVLASVYFPTGPTFTIHSGPPGPSPILGPSPIPGPGPVILAFLIAGLLYWALWITGLVLLIMVLYRVLRLLKAWEREGGLSYRT
jgi:hypothetical protein